MYSVEYDQYTLDKITLNESIIMYRIIPDISNDKTLYIIPGSGHQGVRDVMGIPSEYSKAYYQSNIGKRLALEQGYTIYSIELDGWGERQVKNDLVCFNGHMYTCEFEHLRENLLFYDIDIESIHHKEISTGLSYIIQESTHALEPKISMLGISAGCKLVDSALANKEYINGLVLSSCLGTTSDAPMFGDRYGKGQNLHAREVDMVMAMSPVPLYVSYGKQEGGIFGYEVSTGLIKSSLVKAYKLHSAEDRFSYHIHENQGHGYHIPSVISFLDLI